MRMACQDTNLLQRDFNAAFVFHDVATVVVDQLT